MSKNFPLRIALTSLLSLVVGCNSDLKALESLANEACACEDRVCAEMITTKMATEMPKMGVPAEGERKAIGAAMEKAGRCIQAARDKGKGS